MKKTMLIALPLLLAGCATAEPGLEPPRAAGDVIGFTAGRCFGSCPTYSLHVSPDGSGLLEPQRFTSVPGPTRFTITPAQYRRLVATLAPHRPAAGTSRKIAHGTECERFATDLPGYVIEWTRPGQAATRLEYQSGCMDARYGPLRVAIAAVPRILDVEHMLNPKAVTP